MSLSPQQIRAAELLSKGHSQQAVGEAVGVSRRTILRWLKQEDFKNLSYGLVGRAAQSPQIPPERSLERRRQAGSLLTPEDLVQDALEAVQGILCDPYAKNCDRLKAATLIIGAGLPQKMAELEAVRVLVEAGWVGDEVLEALINGFQELRGRVKNAFQSPAGENKKALLQLPEEGNDESDFDDISWLEEDDE